MEWELISNDVTGVTERMALAGGYLVRTAWRHPRGIGIDPIGGAAVVWVTAEAMPDDGKDDEYGEEEAGESLGESVEVGETVDAR